MNATTRTRAAATAGIAAIAALLGGTAATVVAVPAPYVSGGAAVADAPAPSYDPGQPILAAAPGPFEENVPAPQQDVQVTAVPGPQQDAAPGPVYNGIQLTDVFHGTPPAPGYQD